MAKSESKGKLNTTRLPTPLFRHPSITNVSRPHWDNSIVPKQSNNNKKTPLKSAIDVLVSKMDQLDGQASEISKVALDEKNDLLSRYNAFQAVCLEHVERFQTEFLYHCNKVRDLSFVQRNKLTKVIEGEDRKLESMNSINMKDDLAKLNLEFHKFSALKSLTRQWDEMDGKGIIKKSDIRKVFDELNRFREETVFKSDIRNMRDKLCQMQQSLVPKIELVTFCDKLESFHSDVLTKALMQSFNQDFDQLTRSLSTTIGSRPTCQSIVHMTDTLEDTTKRLGLELRKLNMQINNEQMGTQDIVSGDNNATSKIKVACDHYLKDELIDHITEKMEEEIHQCAEFCDSLNSVIDEATDKLVTKQGLKNFEKLVETQKQGNLKQLFEHVKEVEEKASKIDVKNTESKLNRIVYILKQLSDGKVPLDVGKSQEDKAAVLCNKVSSEVESVVLSVSQECTKSVEEARKALVEKCNLQATDIIQKVTETTESEIRRTIATHGKDVGSGEGDVYTLEDLRGVLGTSFEGALGKLDSSLRDEIIWKYDGAEVDIMKECDSVREACKEDLKLLCKTIKDGLNESLDTANKNLIENFDKFSNECHLMHSQMRNDILDSFKMFRKQVPLLINQDLPSPE